MVADAQARAARGERFDRDGKLVTQDPRVAEEGLGSFEGVEVGPAKPDAVDPHDGHPLRGGRLRDFAQRQPARLLKHHLPHRSSFPWRMAKDIPCMLMDRAPQTSRLRLAAAP